MIKYGRGKAEIMFWQACMEQYRADDQVRNLIFVKYKGGSSAKVILYEKEKAHWKVVLSVKGCVGKSGIGKQKEGDQKTPSGIYTVTQAFGICPDPGAEIPYLQVTKDHYWCSDAAYYNRLIDIRQCPHQCRGEHLADYAGLYDYGLFLDYNRECKPGRGSAIFMHCIGEKNYTAGCIAVPKKQMREIIKCVHRETKIVIFYDLFYNRVDWNQQADKRN